jgi:hypothetical protein
MKRRIPATALSVVALVHPVETERPLNPCG